MFNILYRFFFPGQSPQAIRNEYHIPAEVRLNVRLTPEGWFVLTSPDLPGLITEAPNGKELIKMFNDAVLTYYDVPRRKGDVAFNKLHLGGQGVFFLDERGAEQFA